MIFVTYYGYLLRIYIPNNQKVRYMKRECKGKWTRKITKWTNGQEKRGLNITQEIGRCLKKVGDLT